MSVPRLLMSGLLQGWGAATRMNPHMLACDFITESEGKIMCDRIMAQKPWLRPSSPGFDATSLRSRLRADVSARQVGGSDAFACVRVGRVNLAHFGVHLFAFVRLYSPLCGYFFSLQRSFWGRRSCRRDVRLRQATARQAERGAGLGRHGGRRSRSTRINPLKLTCDFFGERAKECNPGSAPRGARTAPRGTW
jgi:hypothetical protein